jgi:hypothetical protein
MAAPATVTLDDVLDAAREIVARGRVVNGGSLRQQIGRGDPRQRLPPVGHNCRHHLGTRGCGRFGQRDLADHNLARSALTAGMDRGTHSTKLKRLGRAWSALQDEHPRSGPDPLSN